VRPLRPAPAPGLCVRPLRTGCAVRRRSAWSGADSTC